MVASDVVQTTGLPSKFDTPVTLNAWVEADHAGFGEKNSWTGIGVGEMEPDIEVSVVVDRSAEWCS
jgi:hypothetical protein